MNNQNLPPLEVYVNNKFLYDKPVKGCSKGHLISVRALQNQSLQFSVLLSNGALYTGLPVNAISFSPTPNKFTIQEAIMWDNISNSIEVICFDTLRYMSCSVKLKNNKITYGNYLFSIDFTGNNDLSRSSEHWKMFHIIRTINDDMIIYPQYRIKFIDSALCDEPDLLLPNKHNTQIWNVGE